MIRDATPADAAQLADIYNYYIAHTHITFEEQLVDAAEMTRRMIDVQQTHPWLVFDDADAIAGFCYATKWRVRHAYRFAAETTVYLRPGWSGRRIGTRLYERLLAELSELGMHVAIGGIALPNAASIALHERMGFLKVAQFSEVGWKLNRWIDVGYWERVLSAAAEN
jgi:L-amino acid N-acyltransferase YncA